MQLSVSSPGTKLQPEQVEQFGKDLEKIDRRLRSPDDAIGRLRVSNGKPQQGYDVLLEVDYKRYHFIAKAQHSDVGIAVREAREDLIRQINDVNRGGHSSMAKKSS